MNIPAGITTNARLLPASGVGGGLREVVARRHGRRRNPARTSPRSSLRTPTNQLRRNPQRWLRKVGRSDANSETPQLAPASLYPWQSQSGSRRWPTALPVHALSSHHGFVAPLTVEQQRPPDEPAGPGRREGQRGECRVAPLLRLQIQQSTRAAPWALLHRRGATLSPETAPSRCGCREKGCCPAGSGGSAHAPELH